jgi:propionyl-CoA carboxylase alpha chain
MHDAPGYGFLSENADFCRTITEKTDAVFLGPAADAMHRLGDKLESKDLAMKLGVNVVPGHGGVVESLEQALELCNNTIRYPVLLKAASGGGGKGMRVCHNDQDIREGWVVAKAEALKFFSDDRLLIEKYIQEPRHIEFQVIAAPSFHGTDVVVFPERECSIQRRNQKIIEESPSVLLLEETRQQMAEQVRTLCRAVGYQSAGTVEFLVDKDQNFYFLEMNTRLQVEHAITEAVCGVDLVKAMLWVGAGWGLPEELQAYTEEIMPYRGHAIEARIYAEDPLRGFLPSTGPLTQYVEPSIGDATSDSYIRIDSGVTLGHVVTPHYDPMLSKVVSYAADRAASITGLEQALDEYVIEGVQHNARLVQSVLRHEAFKKGETPTSFLPTHYPDGFVGVELAATEEEEFAVAAAAISAFRRSWLEQPPLTGGPDDAVMVRLGGTFGGTTFRVEFDEEQNVGIVVKIDGETGSQSGLERSIQLDQNDYDPSNYLSRVSLDGKIRTIQVLGEKTTGAYDLQMHGARCAVLVQSVREYELSSFMREAPKVDTSNQVLSPMPGTLIGYAVHVGDMVQLDQELCTVEAMKMQNIIRSPRSGRIASCKVAVGSSLASDEVIIIFEDDTVDVDAA